MLDSDFGRIFKNKNHYTIILGMQNDNRNTKRYAASSGPNRFQVTGLFRALNFELFVKPNKVVMALGLTAISGCLIYLALMKRKYESQGYYVAVNEDGSEAFQKKRSRWE
ncbi:small integral membrane protein 8-like [Artemia franciscana]|uniref:small integral membrane protein 8-like n=1 Tax=Artemia franciscana TaxID=6661 RepID=UPI0032DA8C77